MISVNDGDITFGWKRDQEPEDTVTLTQTGSGSRLAPAFPTSANFVLGPAVLPNVAGKLAASSSTEIFGDLIEGGTFRQIRYRIQQASLNRDMNVHSISSLLAPSSRTVEA